MSYFGMYQFTENDIPWKGSYLNVYNISGTYTKNIVSTYL